MKCPADTETDRIFQLSDVPKESLDENDILAQNGYKAEFKREFGWFSVIAFAFSVTAILAGIMASFYTPLAAGGPAAVVWTWFWGAIGCTCIGLSVAELVSAYPTSLGIAYVVKFLVPKEVMPVVTWAIGWMNLVGQVASYASTAYALASQITSLAAVGTHDAWIATNGQIVGVMIACLFFHGAVSSLPTRFLARLTSLYMIINIGSVLVVIIGLPIACKDRNSASYVFTHFENNTGWSNNGISFCLGLLAVAWIMTEYDGTAHVSEEVSNAAVKAPVAIITAVLLTAVLGWIMFIVVTICMGTDIQALLDAPSGLPVMLIYERNFGRAGAIAMMVLTIIVQNAGCMVCLQSASRTVFAMARDNMLPFSYLWRRFNHVVNTPLWSIWLVCFIGMLLALLNLASHLAMEAIFAVTSIALDLSYAIPILCKLVYAGRNDYKPGPINMGRASPYVNAYAVAWVSFVSVILILPQSMPVTPETMNYTIVVLMGFLCIATAYYYMRKLEGNPFPGPAASNHAVHV